MERRGDKRSQNYDILFADKQVTVAYSEAALQIYIHKLEKITSKYTLKISIRKTKIIASKGRDPIRRKIVINNNIIEPKNTFDYLDCYIAYKYAKDVTVKISVFLQITEIINRTLKPSQVHRHTRLKIYNTSALPTLLYELETLAIIEQVKSRIKSGKTKFMMRRANYTWQNYKTNDGTVSELKINPRVKKIQNT
jgi:hypothetical protein